MKRTSTLAVMIAAIGGFAAGILLAPKSGKETRDELRTKAKQKRAEAEEKWHNVNDAVKQGRAEAEEFAQDVVDKTQDLSKEARERATRASDNLKKAVDK